MSSTAVRSYIRTHMTALGYTEWTDGFNSQNIPKTVLDKSFFIQPATIAGSPISQADLEMRHAVTIEVRVKGYRNPAGTIDVVLQRHDVILMRLLKASNRLGANIKGIDFIGSRVEPLDASNDNIVLLSIDLEFLTILNPEGVP